MKNLVDFKFNVYGSVGGRNSEVVEVYSRNESVENILNMEDYGESLLYECNDKLDMIMISNMDSEFYLLYNEEEFDDKRVIEILGEYDMGLFFDEGYRVMELEEIVELVGSENYK